MSGGHNVAFFPPTNVYPSRDPGGVNSHGAAASTLDMSDPMGDRASFRGGSGPMSPSGSSALHSPGQKHMSQLPTPVRRSDNLLFLVGLPPPPPAMPPPRKSKRSQSTPRQSRADGIVEERMRAARRMYQSDDLLLVDTLVGVGVGSTMDPISESRSMAESVGMVSPNSQRHSESPMERSLRHQRSMEPVEESWGRSHASPRLQVVAMADDDLAIPAPPHMATTHLTPLSPSENRSPLYGAASPDVPRVRPFSPNFRSGESLLVASPTALRQSPSKSVHSTLPSKSPAHSIGSIVSYDNVSHYRSQTFDEIVEAKSSSSRSRSPPSRHRNATKSAPRSQTPEREAAQRSKSRRKTPERTRKEEGSKAATAVAKVGGPLTRLRPKTPERLRLRPKTPERKFALDRRTITTESSASASITPSNKQPKQGFFRKLFAKKKKKSDTAPPAVSAVEAVRAAESTESESSPTAPSPRVTGSSGEGQPPSQPMVASSQTDESPTIQRHQATVENGSSRGNSTHALGLSSSQFNGSSSLSGSLVSGHIPNVEEDRPGLFAANDDISTLTLPTLEAPSFGFGGNASFESSYRRKDPSVQSGASTDPMGRYWAANSGLSGDKEAETHIGSNPTPTIDPFREPFFAEPDGASPAVHNRTGVDKSKVQPDLKVNVTTAVYDPTGNSPLPSSRRPQVVSNGTRIQDPSPRGYQTPVFLEHPIQDPVGESPLHKNDRGPSALVDGSPFAADPPLHLEPMDESGLVSEGSSLTSGSNVERKVETDRTSIPSPRIPPSPLQHHRKGRALIPRSPLEQVDSDGSVESRKDTISSYSPRVLPPTTTSNTSPLDSVSNDGGDSVQVPTPKTRNTSLASPSGSLEGNKAEDERPKSPQKSPRLSRKAQECSPRRNWARRIPREARNLPEESPEFHAVKDEQPEVCTEQPNVLTQQPSLDVSDQRLAPIAADPINPLASVSSSAASLTSAAKKASKRLTMSNAAKVNARAVAYLHSLNEETTPRAFWKETDSETGSGVGYPSVLVGSLSSAILFGSSTKEKNQGAWETQNSRLLSAYSKGKFKNRKTQGTPLSGLQLQNDTSSVSEAETYSALKDTQTSREGSHFTPTVQSLDLTASSCSSKEGARHLKQIKTLGEKGASRWFGLTTSDTNDSDYLNVRRPRSDLSNEGRAADAKSKSYMVDVNDCFTEQKHAVGEAGTLRSMVAPTGSAKWTGQVETLTIEKNTDDLPSPGVYLSLPSSTTSRTSFAVAKGFEMLREQREHDITTGKADRVSPAKRSRQPPAADNFSRVPEIEPKDPIQRAGRRLLAKAAVPIQAAARRYLAQQEAVDRMWALLEIQSYARRWRAEAVLVASIISAVTIQAIVRGYVSRRRCRLQNEAATLIQKNVRGYMVAAKTYDFIYKVVVTQAHARGWITRLRVHRHLAKVRAAAEQSSACKLQTWWRSHSSQMLYQFLLFDTILAQSVARSYLARRRVSEVRTTRAIGAATKIQTAWRGFKAYADFIFLLVDCMLIQRTVRAWLAKQEAQNRRELRASIRIQTLWRCFTCRSRYVEYCAARLIQAKWRCFALSSRYNEYCAARRIQTKWRCYSAHSKYQDYYAATKIQTAWRRCIAFLGFKRNKGARIIQAQWRCYHGCSTYRRNRAATTIQKEWRSYAAFSDYIFTLADIIRIQQAVRHWMYRKEMSALRIQTAWRSHHALSQYREYKAAEKIQKHWRRTFAEIEYEQSRMCIVTVQSVARLYFARNERQHLRSQNAATTIQKHWRRTSAQNNTMYDLACIMLVQSVARQRSAVREVNRLRMTDLATKETAAAIRIQATWRSFWEFSHYLILQYETVRMQALVRGKLFRQDFNLQLGCCIMIQSAIRRFLALGKHQRQKLSHVLIVGRAWDSRERLSSSRIQFWWRIVLECRKEKKAALVIERFFLMIKRDIEREIQRSERKQRRRAKRDDDDTLLEKAWIKTVDSNTDVFSFASESGSDVFDFSPKAEASPSPAGSRIHTSPRTTRSTVLLSPSVKAMQSSSPGGRSSYMMSPNSRLSVGAASPGAKSRVLSRPTTSGAHSQSRGDTNLSSPVLRQPLRSPSLDPRLLSPTAQLSVAGNTGLLSPATPRRPDSSNTRKTPPPPSGSPHKSSQKRSSGRHVNHHASSPPKHLIMRHEHDLSPMTKPHPKSTRASNDKMKSPHRHSRSSQRSSMRQPDELAENLSLEEAFLDAEIRQAKDMKESEDSNYGKQRSTSHLLLANVQHFFADDLESFDDSCNVLSDAKGLLSMFQRPEGAITGPQSSRSDAEDGRSERRHSRSSSRSKSRHEGSSRSKQGGSSRSSHNGATPKTQSSPSRNASPSMSKPSPRHNKIHVMKAYPDYPKKAPRTSIENVEDDDEYGMI